MIQRAVRFLQSIVVEVTGLALLLVLYGASIYSHLPALGAELTLFQAARDMNLGHLALTHGVPVSAILTVGLWFLDHVVSDTVFVGRALALGTGLISVFLLYLLGSRIFHNTVGAISAGLALACWGVFVNSTLANGVMLQVGVLSLVFLLFFHWFDSAYRSRTLARSLVLHFILLGFALAGALAIGGISLFVFPILVMGSTLILSNRLDLIHEIRYPWLLTPLGLGLLLWAIASSILAGFWPTLVTVFCCQPAFAVLPHSLLGLLPIAPLLIPALLEKDIVSRALLNHGKTLIFLGVWMAWALILGLIFGNRAEVFAILGFFPLLLWLGHYLYEVFRNPVIPKSLQVVVDVMIFTGLMVSVGLTLLTFQLVPSDLKLPFFLLCCLLPLLSVVLGVLREFTTSRFLVLSMIPYGLILCVLAQNTLLPLARYTPSWKLAPRIETLAGHHTHSGVIEWQNPTQPESSITRLIVPKTLPVQSVSTQAQLESALLSRDGERFVILPEQIYYHLSWRLREGLYPIDQSWQWRTPFTAGTILSALQNERLDLSALTEPVYLLKAPAGLE